MLESVKERKAKTEYLLFHLAQQSTSVCTLKGFCPPRQGPVFHEETPKQQYSTFMDQVSTVKLAVIGQNVPFVLWDGGAGSGLGVVKAASWTRCSAEQRVINRSGRALLVLTGVFSTHGAGGAQLMVSGEKSALLFGD